MQYFEWNLPNDGKLWVHLKEDAMNEGLTKPGYNLQIAWSTGYAAGRAIPEKEITE